MNQVMRSLDRGRALIALLEAHGELPAADVERRLGISQPTLSRAVRAAGERVARIGAARATRYAATRAIGSHGHRWPLHRIDAGGRASTVGSLTALAHGRFLVEADLAAAAFPRGAQTLYPDLPWFLDDARPQGFVGRAFARRVADIVNAPRDLVRWSADHAVAVWLLCGDDLPGDFVVGDAALKRVLAAGAREPGSIPVAERAARYAALADATRAGDVPGSSPPGGEQPKFAACVHSGAGDFGHVLVKFTDAAPSPVKRRWCDLLICEHLAAETLRGAGIAAAVTELVVAGERLCLEVARFDRIGAHGRRGMVSLLALDAQFHGALDEWPRAADRLAADGWMDDATCAGIHALWWFGALIANADMHFGNLSFLLERDRPLALAPVYDMLPMAYRPAVTGDVAARAFEPPAPLPAEAAAFAQAAPLAIEFWRRVAGDPRVSLPFREIARLNAGKVDALRLRIGRIDQLS